MDLLPTSLDRFHKLTRALGSVTQLRTSRFIRSAGVLSYGSAVGHAFTLAVAPILTRVYRPSEFGQLGLFGACLSVMAVGVTLQYEVSIVSGSDEHESTYLAIGSLLFALPVSLIAGVVLWILMHYSGFGYSGLPRLSPLLLTGSMCFLGVFAALRYWCVRQQNFKPVSQGLIVQSAGRAMLQTGFGLVGFHATGLLAGETLGRCLGMSRMFRSAWPTLWGFLPSFRWQRLAELLWRNRRYPLYSLPSAFIDAACLSLSVPLLVRLYGESVGGYYSLVWRALAVPTVLVTTAVADTFHSRAAVCVRDTPDKIMNLFNRTTVGLLLIGIAPAAILSFWSEPLFCRVFGRQWVLSGQIAGIIAPWYLLQFVVSPVSRIVLVLSGQEMKLIWDVLCLISLLAVFWVAQRQGLPPLQTIRLLTVVNAALWLLNYLMLVHITRRFTESGTLAQAV